MRNYLAAIEISVLTAGLPPAETRTYDLSPGEGSRVALEVYKIGLMSGVREIEG